MRVEKSNVAIVGIRDSSSFHVPALLDSDCECTVGFYDEELEFNSKTDET